MKESVICFAIPLTCTTSCFTLRLWIWCGLQIDINKVILVRRQGLHSWQCGSNLSEQCLHEMMWYEPFSSLALGKHDLLLYKINFHHDRNCTRSELKNNFLWIWSRKKEITRRKLTKPDRQCIGRTFMLKPAFELVSINMTPNSLALASPSSIDTWLKQIFTQTKLSTAKLPSEDINTYLQQKDDLHNQTIKMNQPKFKKRLQACTVFSPFVNKICLIANKHYDNIASTLCSNFFNPPSCVQKRLPICSQCIMSAPMLICCFVRLNCGNKKT